MSVPNVCANCKHGLIAVWYFGLQQKRVPWCELKKAKITMADKDCEVKEEMK